MGNPLVHALVVLAAILIPGGLLVYFGWRAAAKSIALKAEANDTAQNAGLGYIPGESEVTPAEALSAFRDMFPVDSLRARNRRRKLERAKAVRHRKFRK